MSTTPEDHTRSQIPPSDTVATPESMQSPGPSAWQGPPAQEAKTSLFSSRLAWGILVGGLAHAAGFGLMMLTAGMSGAGTSLAGVLWPYLVIAVVAVALTVWPRTRAFGVGMLVACVAAWLIMIVPWFLIGAS